jgi:hypothetical protein
MAESPAFTHLCHELEEATGLDRLEARGTVRIVLKAAGLSAKDVSNAQTAVAVTRLLPAELEQRGVPDAGAICESLARSLDSLPDAEIREDSPESVFGRMGSR